jgi:hypothetical protein
LPLSSYGRLTAKEMIPECEGRSRVDSFHFHNGYFHGKPKLGPPEAGL